MQSVELFCGDKIFSSIADSKGIDTFTVDYENKFNPDLCINIADLTADMLPKDIHVLFASPDCCTFSIASGNSHFDTVPYKYRKYNLIPKTEKAHFNYHLIEHLIQLIFDSDCLFYFIENPRGLLNHHPAMKMIPFKASIYYADYGMNYMKPTDIWHNCFNWIPRIPKHKYSYKLPNNNLNNLCTRKRSHVPFQLCEEILSAVI